VLGEDEARQMVMHWVRDVPKEKICEGWDEGLEANTPSASADIKKNFAALCGLIAGRQGRRQLHLHLPARRGGGGGDQRPVQGQARRQNRSLTLFSPAGSGRTRGPGEAFRESMMGKQ